MENKTVLDPCCGGRMFYFDKNHPNVQYGDKRIEHLEMMDRGKVRVLDVKPDTIVDFTNMQFADNSFKFVVFDPPHLLKIGQNSWLRKKYEKLQEDTWKDVISKGLSECLRVVEEGSVVAMKWSERDIKTVDMIKILPQKPDFGDKSGTTRWLFFIKRIGEQYGK